MVRRRRDEGRSRLRVPQAGDELVHLVCGKLTAFARLCALGELDLQVLRGAEILDRHAKATRSDLLDCAVLLGAEAFGILAAFAGVRHRAESVQGEGDRLVRLGRERAERHRTADEVVDNRIYGLDVFYTLYTFCTYPPLVGGSRFKRTKPSECECRAKLQLRPKRHLALLVDIVGVAFEARVVVVAHGLAEVDKALRRPEMLLSIFPCPVLAACIYLCVLCVLCG